MSGGGTDTTGGNTGSNYTYSNYKSDPSVQGNWNTGGTITGHGSMDGGITPVARGILGGVDMPDRPGQIANMKKKMGPGLLAYIMAHLGQKPMLGLPGGKIQDRIPVQQGYNFNMTGGHGILGYGDRTPSPEF